MVKLLDYELQTGKDFSENKTYQLGLPKSNVLQFILADGSIISARPSGTEPKIKFYFSVNMKLNSAGEFEVANAALDQKIETIIREMGLK